MSIQSRTEDLKPEQQHHLRPKVYVEMNHQVPLHRTRIYYEVADAIQRILGSNWYETNHSHQIRQLPIKFLTPTVYWFIICFQYFSRRKLNQSADEIISEIKNQYDNLTGYDLQLNKNFKHMNSNQESKLVKNLSHQFEILQSKMKTSYRERKSSQMLSCNSQGQIENHQQSIKNNNNKQSEMRKSRDLVQDLVMKLIVFDQLLEDQLSQKLLQSPQDKKENFQFNTPSREVRSCSKNDVKMISQEKIKSEGCKLDQALEFAKIKNESLDHLNNLIQNIINGSIHCSQIMKYCQQIHLKLQQQQFTKIDKFESQLKELNYILSEYLQMLPYEDENLMDLELELEMEPPSDSENQFRDREISKLNLLEKINLHLEKKNFKSETSSCFSDQDMYLNMDIDEDDEDLTDEQIKNKLKNMKIDINQIIYFNQSQRTKIYQPSQNLQDYQQSSIESDEKFVQNVRTQLYKYQDEKLNKNLPISTVFSQLDHVLLDNTIGIFSELYNKQKQINSINLNKFVPQVQQVYEKEKQFLNIDDLQKENDLLYDIRHLTKHEEEFLDYMENKQQGYLKSDSSKSIKEIKKKEYQGDSITCQICNDSDGSETNLIVYCSKCNISVHQKCYGIVKVPEGDWICQVCQNFGVHGQLLRCLLCQQRGGAMKPSKIPIEDLNSPIMKMIQIHNPQYYQFVQKKLKDLKTKRNQYNNDNFSYNFLSQQYDNQFTGIQLIKKNNIIMFEDEQLENEPLPFTIWAHMSCIYWHPELHFEEGQSLKFFRGIDHIDKRKFNLQCNICKQKRLGACISCHQSKCQASFHVECARRYNMSLEINKKEKFPYLIFCDKHTPLKLRKIIQNKERKYKDELQKFGKVVEKFYEHSVQIQRQQNPNLVSQNNDKFRMNKKQTVQDDQEFSRCLYKYLNQLPQFQFRIDLERSKEPFQDPPQIEQESSLNDGSEVDLEIDEYQDFDEEEFSDTLQEEHQIKPLNGQKTTIQQFQIDENEEQTPKYYYRVADVQFSKLEQQKHNLSKNDELWYNFQYKNYSPFKLYKKYRKVLKSKVVDENPQILTQPRVRNLTKVKINSDHYLKLIKNNIGKQQQKKKKSDNDSSLQQQLFCICRRPYLAGQLMMECQQCQEWFHFDCIGFNGTEEIAATIDFNCVSCLQNMENKEKIMLKNIQYFNHEYYKLDNLYQSKQDKKYQEKQIRRESQFKLQDDDDDDIMNSSEDSEELSSQNSYNQQL